MTPKSLEDHAAMRLAGESTECLCDEYSHQILHQAAEIKILREKIKAMRLPLFLMTEKEEKDATL